MVMEGRGGRGAFLSCNKGFCQDQAGDVAVIGYASNELVCTMSSLARSKG